jgi:protein TonB
MTIPHRAGPTTDKNRWGGLSSATPEPRVKAFASNLHQFLFDRPAKSHSAEKSLFTCAGFGTGLKENFREMLKPMPKGPAGSGLLTRRNSEPRGFAGFRENLREAFVARKITLAKGERVPEIWSKNGQFPRVQALSVAIHVTALALILTGVISGVFAPANLKPKAPDVTGTSTMIHFTAPPDLAMTGGGSSHDKGPATKGKAPKLSTTQFAVPTSHPLEHPQVAMRATVLANPAIQLPNVNSANWGNPLAGLTGNSLGDRGGNGIGNGNQNGIGDGGPYGAGEAGPPSGTGGYGMPACLYCPNAQFSDEAVKAKYQGVVVVAALITPDGHATHVHVVKGLGMGLDENAVAAVQTWRFRPAKGPDGKPSAVEQTIEVDFRLI